MFYGGNECILPLTCFIHNLLITNFILDSGVVFVFVVAVKRPTSESGDSNNSYGCYNFGIVYVENGDEILGNFLNVTHVY